MSGRGEYPRCLGVVHVARRRAGGRRLREEGERRAGRGRNAGDRAHDLRHLAGAEHGVDLRDLGAQFVAVTLGKAPGHDQAAARAILLVPRHLQDRVNRLLFRRVDEGAGIDDEHVGRGLVLDELVPSLARQSEHHLGVDEILGAAEGHESNFHTFYVLRSTFVVRRSSFVVRRRVVVRGASFEVSFECQRSQNVERGTKHGARSTQT